MNKNEFASFIDRMSFNVKRIRSNAFNLKGSLSPNLMLIEKLNGVADGIEMVINGIKKDFSLGDKTKGLKL